MTTNYCPGCMSPRPALNTCLFCHFQESTYQPPKTALAIGTRVDAYQLGAMVASSRQAQCYVALDLTTEKPVLLEEFFPFTVVGRVQGKPMVIETNANTKFALVAGLFESSKQKRSCPLVRTFRANNTAYRVYELAEGEKPKEAAQRLLDDPIVFQDDKGRPMMSINAITIPPMPKERSFRGTKKKEKSNQLLVAVLGVLVALLTVAVIAFSGILTPKKTDVKAAAPEGDRYITIRDTLGYDRKKMEEADYDKTRLTDADIVKKDVVVDVSATNDQLNNVYWLCTVETEQGEKQVYIDRNDVVAMTGDGLKAYMQAYATPEPSVDFVELTNPELYISKDSAKFYAAEAEVAQIHADYYHLSYGDSTALSALNFMQLPEGEVLQAIQVYAYMGSDGAPLSTWYRCSNSSNEIGYVNQSDVFRASKVMQGVLNEQYPVPTPVPTAAPQKEFADMILTAERDFEPLEDYRDPSRVTEVVRAYSDLQAIEKIQTSDGAVWYYCSYENESNNTVFGYVNAADVSNLQEGMRDILNQRYPQKPEELETIEYNNETFYAVRDFELLKSWDTQELEAYGNQYQTITVMKLIKLSNGDEYYECDFSNGDEGFSAHGFVDAAGFEPVDDAMLDKLIAAKLIIPTPTPAPTEAPATKKEDVKESRILMRDWKGVVENTGEEISIPAGSTLYAKQRWIGPDFQLPQILCKYKVQETEEEVEVLIDENLLASKWRVIQVSEKVNRILWMKGTAAPENAEDPIYDVLDNVKIALMLLGVDEPQLKVKNTIELSDEAWAKIHEISSSDSGQFDILYQNDYELLMKESYPVYLFYRYLIAQNELEEQEGQPEGEQTAKTPLEEYNNHISDKDKVENIVKEYNTYGKFSDVQESVIDKAKPVLEDKLNELNEMGKLVRGEAFELRTLDHISSPEKLNKEYHYVCDIYLSNLNALFSAFAEFDRLNNKQPNVADETTKDAEEGGTEEEIAGESAAVEEKPIALTVEDVDTVAERYQQKVAFYNRLNDRFQQLKDDSFYWQVNKREREMLEEHALFMNQESFIEALNKLEKARGMELSDASVYAPCDKDPKNMYKALCSAVENFEQADEAKPVEGLDWKLKQKDETAADVLPDVSFQENVPNEEFMNAWKEYLGEDISMEMLYKDDTFAEKVSEKLGLNEKFTPFTLSQLNKNRELRMRFMRIMFFTNQAVEALPPEEADSSVKTYRDVWALITAKFMGDVEAQNRESKENSSFTAETKVNVKLIDGRKLIFTFGEDEKQYGCDLEKYRDSIRFEFTPAKGENKYEIASEEIDRLAKENAEDALPDGFELIVMVEGEPVAFDMNRIFGNESAEETSGQELADETAAE